MLQISQYQFVYLTNLRAAGVVLNAVLLPCQSVQEGGGEVERSRRRRERRRREKTRLGFSRAGQQGC